MARADPECINLLIDIICFHVCRKTNTREVTTGSSSFSVGTRNGWLASHKYPLKYILFFKTQKKITCEKKSRAEKKLWGQRRCEEKKPKKSRAKKIYGVKEDAKKK